MSARDKSVRSELGDAERDGVWRRKDSWVTYQWRSGQWWAGTDPQAPFPGIWTPTFTRDGKVRYSGGFERVGVQLPLFAE